MCCAICICVLRRKPDFNCFYTLRLYNTGMVSNSKPRQNYGPVGAKHKLCFDAAFQVKLANCFIWTSCPLPQAATVTDASDQYGHKRHVKSLSAQPLLLKLWFPYKKGQPRLESVLCDELTKTGLYLQQTTTYREFRVKCSSLPCPVDHLVVCRHSMRLLTPTGLTDYVPRWL